MHSNDYIMLYENLCKCWFYNRHFTKVAKNQNEYNEVSYFKKLGELNGYNALNPIETLIKDAIDSGKEEYLRQIFCQQFLIHPGKISDYFAINSVDWINDIREKQISSFNPWLDFLFKNEEYPTWYKYYVFHGIIRIINGIKEHNDKKNADGSLQFRTPITSILPFISFDKNVLDIIYKQVNGDNSIEEYNELDKINQENKGSFEHLYIYLMQKSKYIMSQSDESANLEFSYNEKDNIIQNDNLNDKSVRKR